MAVKQTAPGIGTAPDFKTIVDRTYKIMGLDIVWHSEVTLIIAG